MPFSKPANKIKKDCVSLQVHKSKEIPEKNKIPLYCRWKRVFLFISRKNNVKGSITIEALIALTIFMVAVLFVESYMIVINTEMSMQININNIVRHTAKNMFYVNVAEEASRNNKSLEQMKTKIRESLKDKYVESEVDGKMLGSALGKGYLMAQLLHNTKLKALNKLYILNGVNGVDITRSKIEDGMVDMIVNYKIKIPLVNKYLPISQRAEVKDWTGRDLKTESEKVYITETGHVYHRSKNCSHLVIRISKTTFGQVGQMRNTDGGKYYACRYCVKKGLQSDSGIFITEDGDKYHTSLQCQGLTRHVIEIDIHQAGERKPCSECGQGE